MDTAPIRQEERFDEKRVSSYLRSAVPDLVGDHPILFDQFPGGAANLTYRATAGPTELVLRRAPLGEVAKGGHDMEREYRVLSRLWTTFPLAPRAYAFCEDPTVMGKPFFVMERRKGYVVRSSWPSHFVDATKRTTTEDLVATMARLHMVDPHEVGLDDLGRPEGFVERQVEGWSRRWEAAKTRDVPDIDVTVDLLRSMLPATPRHTLLHNDFKLDNTMIGDDGKLVGVFDWDMATRGDPLVDLGTLLAYWMDPDGPAHAVFAGRVVPLTPHMSKSEVIALYGEHTGFDVDRIAYYEGLAFFRIAVILEQIYARYAAGQTTDDRFAAFAPAAGMMAGAARAVLSGSTL